MGDHYIMFKGDLKMSMNLAPLKKLQKQSPKLFQKAMEMGAVQFLNWANNGSAKETRKPPIRWGVLRGSSSGFVGNKLVMIFPCNIKPGGESKTPAKSHSGDPLTMTWVWNTDYAKKMHEWGQTSKEKWGKFTKQDKNAGNFWLLKHLQKDKDDLMKVISKEFGKVAGL